MVELPTHYATVRLDRVGSTQTEARGLLAGRPVLVVADRQDAGRGRSGRRWAEADRGLYASLAFAPEWPPSEWPVLPLLAGLAARDALAGRPGLKWPNDLVLDDGKVGGILVEAADGEVVAGLGVNLWWQAPLPGATGLHQRDPGPAEAERVARAWADELLARVADPSGWHAEYAAACVTLGRDVTWSAGPPPGRGRAVAIGADGSLIVEASGRRQALVSGEVREVRTATLGRRLPRGETP